MFDIRQIGDHMLLADDIPLVTEAYRRVQASKAAVGQSGEAVLAAIVDELRQGRRDLFGLSKAGRRAASSGRT